MHEQQTTNDSSNLANRLLMALSDLKKAKKLNKNPMELP